MTVLADAPDIRQLADGDLAEMFAAADDQARDAIVGELGRRDGLEQDRRRREAQREEWESGAYAQMLEAERECCGNLVSRRGVAMGITDWSLWSGPESRAMAYATEELRNFWDSHKRVTVSDHRDQIAAGRRIQRDEIDRAKYAAGPEDKMIGELARGAVRTAEFAARQQQARQRVSARTAEIRQASGVVATRDQATLVRQREPVDGDETLRYIFTALKRFAVWNSEAEIVTAALWIASTHARDSGGMPVWQYCPRLGIFGPSGSGKSQKSRLVGKLSYKGKILVEPTKPSFIDMCADHHTVIITEADEAFRSPGRSRSILAVINASYEPDRSTTRKQGGVAIEIPLFTPIVLDGIDTLLSAGRPDLRAMITRTICILSRRAPEGYRPPRFDAHARAAAEMLSQQVSAWMAQEVEDGMADDVPSVPEHLGNRPFSLWEPLFTIAARADRCLALRQRREAGEETWQQPQEGDGDGPWSAAALEACEQLESQFGQAGDNEDAKTELDSIMQEWGLG